MKSNGNGTKPKRLGMVIDLDRCTGCGACMVACAVENNVAPGPAQVTERKGITLLKVSRLENGQRYPKGRTVFIPVMCQQCGHEAPCVAVCPQQAVDVDPQTGVVGQVPQRCLGCRYCMAACPYHARYFNWWDPTWPAGMEKALNPGVAPRMRGVVEKCNLCHARWQAARSKAATQGKRGFDPADAKPACAEACPSRAIIFGDLDDPASEAARLAKMPDAFRLLEQIGTEPKVYYRTKREWVRKEVVRG
jgi:molybdopterin-containing oxidoreductase family iron-sulfur binding subunit